MKSASFIFNFDTSTKTEVSLSGKTFSIKIEAEDISTLRAACNSYLRWINTALNVKKTV